MEGGNVIQAINATVAEFWVIPAASVVALIFAFIFFKGMMKHSEGTDRMKEIAGHVRTGAMAYLGRQYRPGYGICTQKQDRTGQQGDRNELSVVRSGDKPHHMRD